MAKMPPATGSGKSQITASGQTKGRFASDHTVQVKGDPNGSDARIKIKD